MQSGNQIQAATEANIPWKTLVVAGVGYAATTTTGRVLAFRALTTGATVVAGPIAGPALIAAISVGPVVYTTGRYAAQFYGYLSQRQLAAANEKLSQIRNKVNGLAADNNIFNDDRDELLNNEKILIEFMETIQQIKAAHPSLSADCETILQTVHDRMQNGSTLQRHDHSLRL